MPSPHARSFLPTSLFARALTILLVPIVLLQLVVGLVFFQRHYQRVTEKMTENVALELGYAIAEADAAPDAAAAAARLAEIGPPLDLALALDPGATVSPGLSKGFFDVTGATVAATLERRLDRPVAIDFTTDAGMPRIAIDTVHGVLETTMPRQRLSVSNPHQLLVLMIIAAVLLTAIAVVFLRNQVRPIRQLAEVAEAFGKGRVLPFRPRGAEEVRRAGTAFLAMRARIERQIEQRTQMLSGVSHDLRTPLTRMKLTLELMDDGDDVAALRQDVDQMERMLGAFLAFARGGPAEASAPTDPLALARAIAEDARRAGTEIALDLDPAPDGERLVELRRGAVTRAVENLLANGARHGRRVRLAVELGPRSVAFAIEDDGPGIPEADRARAVQPFTRLDAARSQDAGGHVGLGLSIAMDVARSHGGSLELGDSRDLGGLRAVLRLPR